MIKALKEGKMKSRTIILTLPILILALVLLACSSSDNSNNESSHKNYDNPFEYCKAVGTVDTPGTEYTGAKVPEVIAEKLKQKFGAPASAQNDMFIKGTFWRCMDGNVYACNVGANLPCEEKADVSKEPNEGILNYCNENPGSDFIPMYASGRTTVYEWKCDGTTPEIVKQISETDHAGYIKNIWYEIKP